MLLSLALAAALDLRLELVRESLSGTHCRYREYVNGIATDNYVTLSQCDAATPQREPDLRWVGSRIARVAAAHPAFFSRDETGTRVRSEPRRGAERSVAAGPQRLRGRGPGRGV